MFAILSIDNEGRATELATARTYTEALHKANDLTNQSPRPVDHNAPIKRTTATIAYKHYSHYEAITTLTYERNMAPILHDNITFED